MSNNDLTINNFLHDFFMLLLRFKLSFISKKRNLRILKIGGVREFLNICYFLLVESIIQLYVFSATSPPIEPRLKHIRQCVKAVTYTRSLKMFKFKLYINQNVLYNSKPKNRFSYHVHIINLCN